MLDSIHVQRYILRRCELRRILYRYMSTKKTLTDYAFDILSSAGKSAAFNDLFEAAAEAAGIPESLKKVKKRKLYGELNDDSRFVSLPGNVWDLKNRVKFEDTQHHLDLDDDNDDEDDEMSLEDSEEDEKGNDLDVPGERIEY